MSAERLQAMTQFARAALGGAELAVEVASADASFRSYYRVRHAGAPGASWIVMNAPPDKEDTRPFIDIATRLRAAGLSAPEVLASDVGQGFLLLGDLGQQSYLAALHEHSVDALYGAAMQALHTMQTGVHCTGLPAYDEARLRQEMELLPTWFLMRHLNLQPGCTGWERIEACFSLLLRSALEQPMAFVHRDYHSRNLMVLAAGNPGILDFQDAVIGPITYDLVSLLKDCYIEWPLERVHGWAESFRLAAVAQGRLDVGPTRWRRWFDWMGLQRHLKVLGIFARLAYRDGKLGYLKDLPLVLRYTLNTCARYGELAGFGEWLESVTRGQDLTRLRAP